MTTCNFEVKMAVKVLDYIQMGNKIPNSCKGKGIIIFDLFTLSDRRLGYSIGSNMPGLVMGLSGV